jgi:hypothetical protein
MRRDRCGHDIREGARFFGSRGTPSPRSVFASPSGTDAPEMLVLSAGGSWGAWGAGVLYGWAQSGTRPQFEVITGSSTGALLGVFAILAGPCLTPGACCVTAMDDKMKRVYTTVKDDDIYKQRSPLCMPLSNSINTLGPLRQLARNTCTPAVVQQVGQIYTTTGRQLWVGTTNLDTGEFCTWNLSRIALLGQYSRFIDLLIASSANPGIFDAVYIDGALHADGGVCHQIHGAWVEGAVNACADATTTVSQVPPDKIVPAQMLDLFNQGLLVGGDTRKWTAGVPPAGVPNTECLPPL